MIDYNYFKEHQNDSNRFKSNQEESNSDPKAIQQINFTENLDRAEGSTMFFIIEEAKETVLDFSQGTAKEF